MSKQLHLDFLANWSRANCCQRSLFSVALLLLMLGACSAKPEAEAPATEAPSLTEWLDDKFEEGLQFSPIQMTFLGRKDRYDELGSFTFEALSEELAWRKESVEALQATFDRADLSADEQLSYDLWIYQYERAAESAQFFYDGLTFDQMNGAQSFIPTFLINFHRVDTAEDARAYISRINEVLPRMEEMLATAEQSSKQGVQSPGFALNGVIEQSRAVITGAPFTEGNDSDIWADFKMEVDALKTAEKISEAQAASLLTDAESALKTSFEPAYQAIIAWADTEMDKAPQVVSGIGSQPNGAAYYKHRLKSQTTTSLTADEIHQIGLDEIKRLRGDMQAIMTEVGFEGDLQAFFEDVRTAEWNYYPDTDEGRQQYIDDATQAINNLKSKIPEFFGLMPKADLVVKRVEPFRERDGAAQHYYRGTPDGSRPGIYYAHLSDMTAMPKNMMEVIAYHEGIPGHHMQISIAQELTGLPVFRTQAGFTAYSEGWGLYAEALAAEMPGTYVSPYDEFGRLSSEIWRAIRLVVDTGLHAKGWTEQEAIDFFMANSPEPLESVRSEVQRYIVMPGQATSYKIGMLKIQALRRKAKQALGEQFDIRGFHDAVLGGGALPLDMLEESIDLWIASQQT